MRKRLKLLVLACVVFGGLAFASPALASYKPTLIMNEANYNPAARSTFQLIFDVPSTDDATAKATIRSPTGYAANVTASPGATIGAVTAVVKANALGGGTLNGSGSVVVGNPADPNLVSAATKCTGAATHSAIWLLRITVSGQTLEVPLFVDSPSTGVVLQVCLPSPFVPEAQGGARFGAQILTANIIIADGLINPASQGLYVWSGFFTPWTASTTPAPPNAAGTVEARALMPHPYQIKIKLRKRKGNKLTIQGQVTSALPLNGARLDVYAGTNKRRLKRVGRTGKVKNGKFTFTRTAGAKATYVEVDFGPVDVTSDLCGAAPSPAPGGCVNGVLANAFSNTLTLPKRKKHRHR